MSKGFIWINRFLVLLTLIALIVNGLQISEVFFKASEFSAYTVLEVLSELVMALIYLVFMVCLILNEKNKQLLLKIIVFPYLGVALVAIVSMVSQIIEQGTNYGVLAIATLVMACSMGVFGCLVFDKYDMQLNEQTKKMAKKKEHE
jgi:ABC-type multidrug transport system permease subunit